MQNFMVADLVQTTLASFAFALFLLPSGYLLGLAGNIFGMRSRSAAEKVLFSAAFSIAVTPILAVLLTRLSSYKVTLVVFLLLALVALATLVRQLPHPAELFTGVHRSTWLLLGMMLAWFLVVQFSLADLQIGHRLYVNYVAYDHSVRVPFVEAAARTGVPPRNPFYGLGTLPVLRYFYYWYVVCALPMQLFGLSAKACLDASVFWSGLGLASTIPLFLKHFFGETEHLRRKSVIGIALLTVTGLDLFPYAAEVYRYHTLPPDMEWWDTNQVTSWLGSLLWVPHHVASLTASMAGLLALSTIEEETPLQQTAWAALLAGLAFASAAGLSVYVIFPFALFAILWALLTLVQGRLRAFAAYLAAGVFSLLLSWPYLADLLSKQVNLSVGIPGAPTGGGERFAILAIRDYLPAQELLTKAGLSDFWLTLAKLPVLLYVYALEFGFFAVILVLCARRDRQSRAPLSRQRRMAWMLLIVSLLAMSFLKSESSGANDLGFRGMLVVQFVLLLWSAPIVDEVFFRLAPAAGRGEATLPDLVSREAKRLGLGARWVKPLLLCTLVLGVAGSAFQLTLLRVYAPLADSGKLLRSERFLGAPGFGKRTYWLRDGLTRLTPLTSAKTTVQYNPVRDEVLIVHLYSARQAVMGDAYCGGAFGGDGAKCQAAFPYFAALFNNPPAIRGWNLDGFCDQFQVNVLVATNADPVWHDPSSWVWRRNVLLANPGMRAIPCGTSASLVPLAR